MNRAAKAKEKSRMTK